MYKDILDNAFNVVHVDIESHSFVTITSIVLFFTVISIFLVINILIFKKIAISIRINNFF